MYQTIIDFFQTNKGEEFTLGIGYLSGLSEVYGKGINSGRDGESFTDEEKEKLRSFGDDELSEYADNPVVSRKKQKNPYRPDSNTNRLIRYTATTLIWRPDNIDTYVKEITNERINFRKYVDDNPDLVKQYQELHKGFDEKYVLYKQIDGNQDKTINDYIFYLLSEAKGFERREGFERVPDTPFKKKEDKYILNTYIRKNDIKYLTDTYRYFVASSDGKKLKEISQEQALYVSSLFKSPDTPRKTASIESDLEKYAKKLKGERTGIWCDYSMDQMYCIGIECPNKSIGTFGQAIVRISKAVETKTLSKPEVTTEPCLFNIYFDKEEQEKLGQKINLE